MAHCCLPEGQAWRIEVLTGDRGWLVAEGEGLRVSNEPDPAALALICRRSGRPGWALLLAEGHSAQVNRLPVLGMRLLADHDDVRFTAPPGRLVFSTQEVAHVAPYAGAPVECARCTQPIRPGDEAVACPACGHYHHQHAGLPCWTYAPTCGFYGCNASTAADAPRWRPEV
jgi:hypothetical protein